jgi:hypothetical protein
VPKHQFFCIGPSLQHGAALWRLGYAVAGRRSNFQHLTRKNLLNSTFFAALFRDTNLYLYSDEMSIQHPHYSAILAPQRTPASHKARNGAQLTNGFYLIVFNDSFDRFILDYHIISQIKAAPSEVMGSDATMGYRMN